MTYEVFQKLVFFSSFIKQTFNVSYLRKTPLNEIHIEYSKKSVRAILEQFCSLAPRFF